MRKSIILAILFCCIIPSFAAKKRNIEDEKYRRNTLGMMLDKNVYYSVSENGIMDQIQGFYDSFELSDKFDPLPFNKDRKATKFYVYDIKVTDEDLKRIDPDYKKKVEKKKGGFGALLGPQMSEAEELAMEQYKFMADNPLVLTAKTQREYYLNTITKAAQILKWLESEKMANQLIKGWFQGKDVKEGSPYSINLLQERGEYSAAELDKMQADESIRGKAIIQDAGEELIGHTFLAFTDFEIIDAHNYELKQKELFKNGAFGADSKFSKRIQDSYDESASEQAGMYILSTTYLFQLEWNDEVSNNFYTNYWDQPLSKLMKSNDFKIKFIGFERNDTRNTENVNGKGIFQQLGNRLKDDFTSGRLFEHGKTKEEQAMIDKKHKAERRAESNEKRQDMTVKMTQQSLVRSVDETYAQLMKNHEKFKVKAPVIDVEDGYVTAFIGLKEGVKPNSEFEVIEPVFNEKTGKREYRKVAKIKVDKKRIWDNRYTLIDNDANVRKDKKNGTYTLDRTYFKGGSQIAPGMLLVQVK